MRAFLLHGAEFGAGMVRKVMRQGLIGGHDSGHSKPHQLLTPAAQPIMIVPPTASAIG
jgi:hypothetical protein